MNFGLVEEGIYRCGKLEQINNAFVETLQLQSVILLDAEKPPRQLRLFFENAHTDIYHLGGFLIASGFSKKAEDDLDEDKTAEIDGTGRAHETTAVASVTSDEPALSKQEWMVIKSLIISRVLELLLNRRLYNVLLVDSTETLVGVLRKSQHWNYTSIINEYRLYAGNKSNYLAETFLEMIRVELIPHHSQRVGGGGDPQNRAAPLQPPLRVHANAPNLLPPSPILSQSALQNEVAKGPQNVDVNGQHNNLEEEGAETEEEVSGSPKIPSTLLRLMELRKQKKHQEKLQEQQSQQQRRPLIPTQPYAYYRSWNESDVKFSKVRSIKAKLPVEENLPSWFARQRDFWEAHLNSPEPRS